MKAYNVVDMQMTTIEKDDLFYELKIINANLKKYADQLEEHKKINVDLKQINVIGLSNEPFNDPIFNEIFNNYLNCLIRRDDIKDELQILEEKAQQEMLKIVELSKCK